MAVDAASVASVDRSRRVAPTRGGGTVRPLADGYCFAAVPATVERLLLGGDDGGLRLGAHRAARRGDPGQAEGERAGETDGRRDEAGAPDERPAGGVVRRGLGHGHQRSPPK